MTDLEERLAALETAVHGQAGAPHGAPQTLTLDAVLGSIDPRDSDSAIKLFQWLLKNGRLHKMGTLDGVGFMMAYQEPKGSTREGWTHGGTEGDRIVEEALEKAQANGSPTIRGLCPKCYSLVVKADADADPVLETYAEGEDPAVCKDGQPHDFAS